MECLRVPTELRVGTAVSHSTFQRKASKMQHRLGFEISGFGFVETRFEASFIFPRITAALLHDSTIEGYELEIEDSEGFDGNSFSNLLALSRNRQFELNSENSTTVTQIALSLGNHELNEHLLDCFRDAGDETYSNVLDRVSFCESLDVSPSTNIFYLSSHFCEIGDSSESSESVGHSFI
jgi:hypothetical protein